MIYYKGTNLQNLGVVKLKKLLLIVVISAFAVFSAACSSDSASSDGEKNTKETKKEESGKLLSPSEFDKMFSDPKKYKGSKVEFYAKVFVEPEKDDDGTYIQAFANNNSDRNAIIGIEDPDLDVKAEDIIFVSGVVNDVFEGENLMGGSVTAPAIKADKIEKSDYATAFAPAIKTVDVNKEIEQNGYVIKLSKIELAENESRLYVTVSNNTEDNISFYSFNSKIVAGNQQLEPQDNYDAGYPDIQSDILPGVVSEGVIAFPALPESGTVKVLLEGSSENYELSFEPFQFEVTY
jgi:hypothetical protein